MHLICSSCVELVPSLPSGGLGTLSRVPGQNDRQEAPHCPDWVPTHCFESTSSFGYQVLATLTEYPRNSPAHSYSAYVLFPVRDEVSHDESPRQE